MQALTCSKTPTFSCQHADLLTDLLFMQVAQLRALAKTNPNTPIPAMSANSASQKAAALAAAALLQKKFGQTSGPGNADHAIRKRHSPSPDRYTHLHNISFSKHMLGRLREPS